MHARQGAEKRQPVARRAEAPQGRSAAFLKAFSDVSGDGCEPLFSLGELSDQSQGDVQGSLAGVKMR